VPSRRLLVLSAAAATALVACKKDGTSPAVPASVVLSPTTVSFSSINQAQQLGAAVLDQRGDTVTGQTISWNSSNLAVATVSGTGLVQATGNGSAQVTARSGGLTSAPATVTVAQVAVAIVMMSGDGQYGQPSTPLSAPIVVRVNDQLGSPVSGRTVDFVVTSGGGSATLGSVVTGSNGRAQTVWTLGSSLGQQTLEVRSGTLTGSPIAFSATATNLTLTAVQPDTLVEGQSATITGDGFSSTPADNTVLIGGTAATVTTASATTLTVTVPAYDCQPPRNVNVQVSVGGLGSNTVAHPLKPIAANIALAVGQQQILLDPAEFCLRFSASAASEAYLIGVQSLSETPSNLQVTRLISATGFLSAAPPGLIPAFQSQAIGQLAPLTARDERWVRHRVAEREVRTADSLLMARRTSAALVAPSPAAAQVIIPGTVNVGDTVKNVRVWRRTFSCADYDSIAVVVRAKGSRGIWVEDVNNPVNGYTAADIDSLSRYFDNVIFDTDTSYFGDPGDLDGNARIAIVITKEVNEQAPGLLGFVGSVDFFPRASCGTSNEGEFFYVKAPDPTAMFGSTYTRDDALADAPFLIAHEFAHIIQLARRIPAGGAFTRWMLEGQATFAEEVNGFAVAGRSPGQNYGSNVAFNRPTPSTPIDWHVGGFFDLAVYYGFESATTRKAGAPHECTWIGNQSEGNNGPCLPGREVYGVPWSIYRWAADQFGPGFSGGERGLHKAIIGNPLGGYANLATTVGVSIDTLLAQWAAMLYVDDRVPGAAARLTLPSWNLVDVESGLVVPARLQPTEAGFAAFDLARNVRAGSSSYTRISGTSRPATAVRVRSSTDTALPTSMNVWLVRLQ
jgi:IPT/TIG domain-containing protein/Big-like domain-containing protein